MIFQSPNIVEKAIDEVIPYVNNPRNNQAAVDAVASSIAEFGFNVPIVIDRNNVLVTGHTRLLAAKKLGLTKVPCILAEHLTESMAKAYRIADNKVAELATWNTDLLQTELDELKELNFDMTEFGFDEDELNALDDVEEDEVERQLNEALLKLAVGATVEEIGKDENGNTKIFKRKLAPNLDAIKYIRESKKTTYSKIRSLFNITCY